MSVEGCSLYSDDEMNSNTISFSVERNWHGRMIGIAEGGISHLILGYPLQGWGGMDNHIKPMKGSAGGSAEAKADSDGKSSVKGEVHVTVKDDDGNKVTVTAEGTIKNDGDGHVKADGGIKVAIEKEF